MLASTLCPGDYTGLRPVPYDCTKFANCWKGTTFIQSCGPGTHFNPKYSVCDWPNKANCVPTTTTHYQVSTQVPILAQPG